MRCTDAQRMQHAVKQRAWARRNPEKVREMRAASRQRLRERIAAGDPTVLHGVSEATYAAGCRCYPCRDIAAIRRAERRAALAEGSA